VNAKLLPWAPRNFSKLRAYRSNRLAQPRVGGDRLQPHHPLHALALDGFLVTSRQAIRGFLCARWAGSAAPAAKVCPPAPGVHR